MNATLTIPDRLAELMATPSIRFQVREGRLKVDAPKGALGRDDVALIRDHSGTVRDLVLARQADAALRGEPVFPDLSDPIERGTVPAGSSRADAPPPDMPWAEVLSNLRRDADEGHVVRCEPDDWFNLQADREIESVGTGAGLSQAGGPLLPPTRPACPPPTYGYTHSGRLIELDSRTEKQSQADPIKLVTGLGWPAWYPATPEEQGR